MREIELEHGYPCNICNFREIKATEEPNCNCDKLRIFRKWYLAEARVRELEDAANKILASRVSMDGEMMAVSVDSLEELRAVYRKGLKP